MAIIAFSRRCLFIKTRKTAGTSVQESLSPHLVDRDIVTRQWIDTRSGLRCAIEEFASLEDIHQHFPETRTDYFTFGFTRNPYAITLSRYFYQIQMKRIVGPPSPKDFNHWVQSIYCIGEPGFPGGRFLRDRSRYLLFDASLKLWKRRCVSERRASVHLRGGHHCREASNVGYRPIDWGCADLDCSTVWWRGWRRRASRTVPFRQVVGALPLEEIERDVMAEDAAQPRPARPGRQPNDDNVAVADCKQSCLAIRNEQTTVDTLR